MIINIPSINYLIENIEKEEIQLFVISLGTLWRDSFNQEIDDDKEYKMSIFLDLIQEGVAK